jgi:hypothetical protein
MRDITKTDSSLPAINPADPGSMLLLPVWLGSLQRAVSTGLDGEPTWSRVPTIPASSMPTGAQRRAIEGRIAQLDRMSIPGPEATTLQTVTEILTYYAHGNANETQIAIKANIWIEALADVPALAVAEAKRRWFRGQLGETRGFAPDPGVIRQAAEEITKIARGQRVLMQRILAAQPAPELPAPNPDVAAAAAEVIRAMAQGKAA